MSAKARADEAEGQRAALDDHLRSLKVLLTEFLFLQPSVFPLAKGTISTALREKSYAKSPSLTCPPPPPIYQNIMVTLQM